MAESSVSGRYGVSALAREYHSIFRPIGWIFRAKRPMSWLFLGGCLGMAVAAFFIVAHIGEMKSNYGSVGWPALLLLAFEACALVGYRSLEIERDELVIQRFQPDAGAPSKSIIDLKREYLQREFRKHTSDFQIIAESLLKNRELGLELGVRKVGFVRVVAGFLYDPESKQRLLTVGIVLMVAIIIPFAVKTMTFQDLIVIFVSKGFANFYVMLLILFGIPFLGAHLMAGMGRQWITGLDDWFSGDRAFRFLVRDLVVLYDPRPLDLTADRGSSNFAKPRRPWKSGYLGRARRK